MPLIACLHSVNANFKWHKRETMKLINKTIVLTGGTSGIGYQLVKQLAAHNTVLVIARNSERLKPLALEFKTLMAYECDLAQPESYVSVVNNITQRHGAIDVLINNAAIQNTACFTDPMFNYGMLRTEVDVNFTAVCAFSYLFLAALQKSTSPAYIVNINSGLALAPKTNSAVYCASKAAVNTFSKSLGYQLANTNVEVLQAFLPLVDTSMTKGRGSGKITAQHAAREIIHGIETKQLENNIGKVKLLRGLLRCFPSMAYNMMKGY